MKSGVKMEVSCGWRCRCRRLHLGVGVADMGLTVDTVEVLQVVCLVHVLLGLGREVVGWRKGQ